MTYSKLVDRVVPTPNQDVRAGGAKPKFIVHHHEAGTSFESVIESWRTGRKEGSCHITISNEGEKVGIVPEEKRAWSLSSQFFDSQALTTEIENQSAGGSWPVSDAAQEAAAQVTADWCRRYGIPCDRQHVIGHREVYTRFGDSYATACPGGLDLDWIVTRAKAILAAPTGGMGGGLSAPASIPAYVPPAPKPSRSSNYSSTESDGIPGPQFYKLMQLWAREDGYNGPVDGVLGKNTWAAIQRGRKRWDGYDGPIDGIPGVNTYKALQRAAQHGGYDGPIDGVLGKNSYRGLAKLLNGKFA